MVKISYVDVELTKNRVKSKKFSDKLKEITTRFENPTSLCVEGY